MAANRDAARAMLKHGQLKHRMLAAFWWRARADRDEIEQAHAEEFEAFRKVAHYKALAKEAEARP